MIDIDVHLSRGTFTLNARIRAEALITALFGPSGSGKSTLVNIIAGLARPDRGHVVIGDTVLFDSAKRFSVPVWKRRVGLVFQDAQLFPHLTVRQNLLYGAHHAPRDASAVSMETVLGTLGIGHLLAKRPATLSGGERQRVAIGRALLSAPRILLMDEPLAALDQARKAEILPLIERVADEFKVPIIYVSHAVEEVARLADQVVLFEAGAIRAIGAPTEILTLPNPDRFALTSVLTATVAGHDPDFDLTELHHPAGRLKLVGRLGVKGRQVRVLIRATDVTLARDPLPSTTAQTVLSGRVLAVTDQGRALARLDVGLDGDGTLAASVTRQGVARLELEPGTRIHALIKTVALDERPMI
jgi:molybdate transport system ATP-binding protein